MEAIEKVREYGGRKKLAKGRHGLMALPHEEQGLEIEKDT